MFAYCADPDTLEGLAWLSCYLSNGKHMLFYGSFLIVLLLLAVTTPLILLMGFLGALAKRAKVAPIRWFGHAYTSMVRGIPDIIFFLFVPLVLDQGLEILRHYSVCADISTPIYQGNEFNVCQAAKVPPSSAPAWVHDIYAFALAVMAFAVVFGAFAANTLDGALRAVPQAQLETAHAYGFTPRQTFWRIHMPQMWRYALPGLSNLWMILIKATPLLFLLGIEDIVYWARELGGAKSQVFEYPHPDWRIWYFSALLLFYLAFTRLSEIVFAHLQARLHKGQAPASSGAQI